MESDDLRNGVIFAVMVTVPLNVTGYFPPEDKNDKHPPHEHFDVSSGASTQPLVGISGFASTSWVVRDASGPFRVM